MPAVDPVSLWRRTAPDPVGDDRQPDRVDIVVAGAGLAGLATALELCRQGRQVVVLDAGALGGRTTSRTTGKVSLLQGTTLNGIRRHAGDEVLRAYLDANAAGQRWLHRELNDVPGAWEPRSAYTYATTGAGDAALRAEAEAMQAAGRPPAVLGRGAIGLPFAVRSALLLTEQAQLHPVLAADALIQRIRHLGGAVVSDARVRGVDVAERRVQVTTSRGIVEAAHLILTTGMPVLDRGLFFARLTPRRQVVGAYRLPGDELPPEGMYLSADPEVRSLRGAQDEDGRPLLIVGGGDHVTGRADVGARLRSVDAWVRRQHPEAERVAWWAAQDYTMNSRVPAVGRLPGGRARVHVATGFAKWGMTNAAAAALTLAGDLSGATPDWAVRLRRRRTGARDIGETVAANGRVAGRLVAGWVAPGRTTTASSRGRVVRRGIRPVAESRIDGRTCRVSAVCTHLGGVVRWNDAESSWDCPLHGSRFTADGAVIEGPAVKDLPTLDHEETKT